MKDTMLQYQTTIAFYKEMFCSTMVNCWLIRKDTPEFSTLTNRVEIIQINIKNLTVRQDKLKINILIFSTSYQLSITSTASLSRNLKQNHLNTPLSLQYNSPNHLSLYSNILTNCRFTINHKNSTYHLMFCLFIYEIRQRGREL